MTQPSSVAREAEKRLGAFTGSFEETQAGSTGPTENSDKRVQKPRWKTKAGGRDWAPGLLLLLVDVPVWLAIDHVTTLLRGDAFYTSPLQFFVVDVVQLAIIIQALFIVGGYDRHTNMRTLQYMTEQILALLSAGAVSALVVYSAATFDQSMKPSRGVLLLSFLVFLPFSIIYRRVIQGFVSEKTARRAFLVIGAGKLAKEFYRVYAKSINRERLEFVDVGRERIGQHIGGSGSPVIGGDVASKLDNLTSHYSGVILAERVDRLAPGLLERLVRTQFQNTRVYTLESFYEAHWRYVPVRLIDPFWPLQTGFQLSRSSPYHYIKRLFDLMLSSLLLFLTAPLLAVITLLIWTTCGRPAIFRQIRVKLDNEPFTVYKFRTMFARSDEDMDNIYTRRNDPRVTRIGRWLRKLRLDELPQLWNVGKGDMSMIGPRAEWIRCAERYEKIIPFYHFRHLVKPGITGWAQVNYPYGESDEDAIEKLKYDLYYIRHYSLKLDAMIVLKTVYTMLFGKGR